MVTGPAGEATVAVIDDEESMREGCRQTLEERGYRIEVAASGESGLQLVEESRPNVVLVDLLLPGISGIEVIERLPKIDPQIIAVVITGHVSVESAARAMRAGAYDYLAKPFEPERLVDAVASGLERSWLGRRSAELDREKETALSNFAAILCHQLRSPAAMAAQWIEVMRSEMAGPLTPGQRSMLERAAKRMDDLTTSIGDWLRFAEVEAGKLKFRPAPVDMPRVIEEAWKAIPDEEAKGRIDLELQGGNDVKPVLGERDLLRELFTNLLTNSVKFASGPGKVTVDLTAEGNSVVVSVSDTGAGVPEEELAHIFEPFYRGARAGTRRTGGHGLGLAVAKKIVSAHGGTISASSAPGEGATFTLRLPASGSNRGAVSVYGGSTPGQEAAFAPKAPTRKGNS